jgi:hypothetical protein
MEIDMRASKILILAGSGVAVSMLLAPVSLAASRHDHAPVVGAHSRIYVGEGSGYVREYPLDTPRDYRSSHVCINGYRWITVERDSWESPAENATPVPCR